MAADLNDFLVDYDLTDEQRSLASRLKAEANLKQLLNALADHALFFGREASLQRRPVRLAIVGVGKKKQQQPQPRPVGGDAGRGAILAWFSTLDLAQRVSLLTCDDASWVHVVMRMSHLRAQELGTARAHGRGTLLRDRGEGRFRVFVAKRSGPAPQLGPASRTAAVAATRRAPRSAGAGSALLPGAPPAEPGVHYRRPHRLPDGEVLTAPGSVEHRSACQALISGLRVAFKGCCCASLALEWGAVMPSPALVADPAALFAMLDAISLGRFLRSSAQCCASASGRARRQQQQCRPGMASAAEATPWPEAQWLGQWGTHFHLAAFLASRLEVLLQQGFEARRAPELSPPLALPLSEVWTSVPKAQREPRLHRLAVGLLRRLLSETLAATTFGADPHSGWQPPVGLAALLGDLMEDRGGDGDGRASIGWLAERPLELVGAVSTVSLPSATQAFDATMREVLLNTPQLWLHQQFAEELAIACSEHSASALLLDSASVEESARAGASRRSEKKQRQKLKRRQLAAASAIEEQAAVDEAQQHLAMSGEVDHHSQHEGLCSDPQRQSEELPPGLAHAAEEAGRLVASHVARLHRLDDLATQAGELLAATAPSGLLATAAPGLLAGGGEVLAEDWDGTSEISMGVATSRSGSVGESLSRQLQLHAALLGRAYWDAELVRARGARPPAAAPRRWHDDSRLEFLLRNRDRFATEIEWERLSQGSVPASLDEGAMHNVGLEARFAYLFDSPPHSRVSTAMGSQATAEDERERLRTTWEDLKEWQSLTQALERTEGEREMWKAKAQELESLIASGSSDDHHLFSAPVPSRTPPRQPASLKGEGPLTGTVPVASPSQLLRAVTPDQGPSLVTTPQAGVDQRGSPALSRRRSCWRSTESSDASTAPTDMAWRYLVLLMLAQRQMQVAKEIHGGSHVVGQGVVERPMQLQAAEVAAVACGADSYGETGGTAEGCAAESIQIADLPGGRCCSVVGRSISSPGLDARPSPILPGTISRSSVSASASSASVSSASGAASWQLGPARFGPVSRSPSPEERAPHASPVWDSEARKRALHVTFDTRHKRSCLVDSATQTAPAITLSKMYGGMVPRYIQRELARLRQENQILRYRIASLAMSQPIGRPRPVRHQATQTAPALTFSTARQQGSGPSVSSIPRLPPGRDIVGLQQVADKDAFARFEPSWLPPDSVLDKSILAFVRAVESQTQRQESYRLLVQGLCRRAAQVLWPRSAVELYGSFASGLALPSSGLDLVISPHRGHHEQHRLLTPIEEHDDQRHQKGPGLGAVSPGHPGSHVPSAASWQQQLSARLAQEKWVLSDSIRITAHAAVPVLSLITAPEAAAASSEDPGSCPIRVDLSLEDPNHRGQRSKAMINWLLTVFPHARPVTLVLKQWLIERTYGMSHTGGLCSYGLLLLVVGFLQRYPAASAGAALVGCMNFYGRRFDPAQYGVSVARGALLHRKNPIAWPPPQVECVEQPFCASAGEFAALPRRLSMTGEEAHRFDPLWIEDPLNPTNNVGRNCFRIRQILRSLARAADALMTTRASWQLRTILRVEGQVNGEDGERDIGGGADAAHWREIVIAKHALHEDLFQSIAAHAPNLMLHFPAHAQIARSHLPQQWDSVVQYASRPGAILPPRGRC